MCSHQWAAAFMCKYCSATLSTGSRVPQDDDLLRAAGQPVWAGPRCCSTSTCGWSTASKAKQFEGTFINYVVRLLLLWYTQVGSNNQVLRFPHVLPHNSRFLSLSPCLCLSLVAYIHDVPERVLLVQLSNHRNIILVNILDMMLNVVYESRGWPFHSTWFGFGFCPKSAVIEIELCWVPDSSWTYSVGLIRWTVRQCIRITEALRDLCHVIQLSASSLVEEETQVGPGPTQKGTN